MLGSESFLFSRAGSVAHGAVRAVVALFCLLAFLGAPSPVLCLESNGACAEEQGAEPWPASCHDRSPMSIPSCESCTDVAAPEESLASAQRPQRSREILIAGLRLSNVAGLLPAPERSSSVLPDARPVPTPSFIRSTVLLI
jgi:hypothetical protein